MAGIHKYDIVVRWKNFRGFEDTGPLCLRPLTVLIGSNNAGKSTVFLPFLLLAQTYASSDADPPLVSRGPLANVGEFEDFVHKPNQAVTLRFGFHLHRSAGKKIKPVGRYPTGGLEITLNKPKGSERIQLVGFTVFDLFDRDYLVGKVTSQGLQIQLRDLDGSKMSERERDAIQKSRPINFLYPPTNTIGELRNEGGEEKNRPHRFTQEFSEYLTVTGDIFKLVRQSLMGLSYVGPVRERLHRYYEVMGSKPDSVGPRGRQAPELFRRMDKQDQKRVNEWIKKFELGSALKVAPSGPGVFSLELLTRDRKRSFNVADTGFGVSQVLPLIIQAVAGEPYSITIAEQPEIHLNPRLQANLADLFVEMAQSGQRVLVETHSEHFVLRLRRLMAEGKISADDVGLHFVERADEVSRVSRVPVDPDGHIEGNHWPAGFFDEQLNEAIELANAQAKKRRKTDKEKKESI